MPEEPTPESRDDREIDRFWNDLLSGRGPGGAAIDPTPAAAIRAFQSMAATPPPHASRERVDHDVMAAIERTARRIHDADMVQPEGLSRPYPRFAPNGSGPHAAPGAAGATGGTSWRPMLASFATAALVVLVVLAALVAGPRFVLQRDQLVSLPALSGTPTPERGIVSETLFAEPIAALPAGHASIYLGQLRLQPGILAHEDGMVGTMFHRVEQGTLAITLPDEERTLAAGETLGMPMRDGFVVRNSGPDEANVIQVAILDASASTFGSSRAFFSDPTGGSINHLVNAGLTMPAGPGRATLERLTIPPGAALPASTATGLDWVGIASGRLGVVLEGEQLPFRWDPGEERTFGFGQYLPFLSPGTRMTLRNAGDAPLVLYRLTIVPG